MKSSRFELWPGGGSTSPSGGRTSASAPASTGPTQVVIQPLSLWEPGVFKMKLATSDSFFKFLFFIGNMVCSGIPFTSLCYPCSDVLRCIQGYVGSLDDDGFSIHSELE